MHSEEMVTVKGAGSRATSHGLEGVVVARTRLSKVEGGAGRLVIAGMPVEQLEERHTFETLAGALWRLAAADGSDTAQVHETGDVDALPGAARAISRALGEARQRAFAERDRARGALARGDGADAMMAALAAGLGDDSAAGLAGALAVSLGLWWSAQRGVEPVAPDPEAGHAADVLRMVHGAAPSVEAAAALDTYLMTVSDHGMNASTFTARVVASTGSDLRSSVVAALAALKGPLHGGAPGPVLDMLDAVGTADNARAWIAAELAAKRRIMGMGHRVYRARDPRASVLERAARSLEGSQGADASRIELAHAIEREAERQLAALKPDRPLRANVEFFTAVLLDRLGFSRRLFTPLFAVGRVAGWCAHIVEQRTVGRLIRPASEYLG